MKKMKVILLIILLITLFIPLAKAEEKEINNIPVKLRWMIAKDGNGSLINITLYMNSSEDDDHVFVVTLSNTSSNNSDDIEIDIKRDISCSSADISELTKQVLQSNRDVVNSINSSLDMSKRFADCSEGRERIATNSKTFELQRDQYKNESDTYKVLYQTESDVKLNFKSRLDGCSSDLQTKTAEANTCSGDLTQSKKKPMQYAFVTLILTLIAMNMYNKSKEPKPPEMFQFPER